MAPLLNERKGAVMKGFKGQTSFLAMLIGAVSVEARRADIVAAGRQNDHRRGVSRL
jgi:hypothetical protein